MIWYDSLPLEESADTITAELTAGTDYTLEFSRNFTDPLGTRSPAFEVIDPDGELLSADVFSHSLYPRGLPAIICYTFTPQTSGIYSFRVSNADPNLSADIATDSVLFVYAEMHNEAGENGYPTRFKLTDNSQAVSVRDIIQLRKTIFGANPDYIDYLAGKMTAAPNINNDNTEEFNRWLNVLKSTADTYDDERLTASSGKVIPDIVDEIPYDSRYSIGKGLLSTSDFAIFDSAIKSEYLRISDPVAKRGTSLFTYSFISSVEDYERNISGKADISLSYNSISGSAGASYTNNYKFGQTAITFLIHYEEMESSYRELNTDKCELKDDAVNILNQGSDKFRSNYGDYFVAGYRYGGVYNAFITVTAQTREQAQNIEASISGKYKSTSTTVEVDLAFALKEAATRNNASISVEVRTAGANDNLPDMKVITGASAIDSVVEQLSRSSLANAFTPASYAPVKVRLKRYYTLSGARSKISQGIPLSPNDFANIAKLNSTIIGMRGLRNTVEAIPNDHIDTNARSGYINRYDNIVSKILSTGHTFYENPNQIKTTLNDATNLKNDMQALLDRYVFYRMLIEAQNKERNPYKGYTYSGYDSCAWSDVVQGDMNAGGWQWEQCKYEVSQKSRSWNPSYTATLKNGSGEAIFYFIRVWCYGYEDQRQFNNPPAVGKKNISLSFTRGRAHVGHWAILRKSMRFNKTLYPFKGLKQ